MEATTVQVYDYLGARQFLLDSVSALQKGKDLSIRGIAKEMGFASHTLLLMLLQGKRPLRVKHAVSIAKGLKLSSQERLYLQALIQFDAATDSDEKQLCQIWLSDLHPGQKVYRNNDLDELQFYSHWIHTAILAATYLEGGIYSAKDVARLFSKLTTTVEAHAAIERLFSLKLLEKAEDGRLVSTFKRLNSKDDVLNKGIQAYHRHSCELAMTAVEQLPLDLREFQSLSLPVQKEKIPLAKEMIRKFRAQFQKAMGSENANEVYQFNIQFFQLTESPATLVEDEGVDTEQISNKERSHA